MQLLPVDLYGVQISVQLSVTSQEMYVAWDISHEGDPAAVWHITAQC